jgi:hypothetical protein
MSILFGDSGGGIYSSTAQAASGLWQALTATIHTSSLPAGAVGPTALSIGINAGIITVPTGIGPFVVGFRLCITGALTSEQTICSFFDSTSGTVVTFSVNTNGGIKVYRGNVGSTLIGTGSTAVALATAVWAYVELQCSIGAAGTIGVRVNGVSTLQTTANTAGVTISSIRLGSNYANYIQDIVVTNSLGSYNNTYLGDCHISVYNPTSNGSHTDYTANGAASLWQSISASTPTDSTVFASDSNPGDKLSVNLAPTSVTGSIAGVVLVGRMQKTSAGTRTANLFALNGGTEVDGANIALGTSYAYSTQVVEVDPATGIPFVNSGFNALQVGVATAS